MQVREREEVSSPTGRSVAANTQPRREKAAPEGRSTRRSTVLLADDHVVVREGLATLLTDHDFEVVGAVGDGHALIDAAMRLRPDVIVTDISMPPGLSGLDVLARLKAERVESKVVVLTMHEDAELAARAVRAGASGFLLKHAAGEELVSAIHQALQGRVYLTPALTKDVMERLAAPAGRSEPALTARHLDVLRLDPRRTAYEGDRRGPATVHANGRNTQIRDDAAARRLLHGRTRHVCHRAPADRATEPAPPHERHGSVVFRAIARSLPGTPSPFPLPRVAARP